MLRYRRRWSNRRRRRSSSSLGSRTRRRQGVSHRLVDDKVVKAGTVEHGIAKTEVVHNRGCMHTRNRPVLGIEAPILSANGVHQQVRLYL